MYQIIQTPKLSDIIEKKEDNKATFVIEPLLAGYGLTLGNSLRRVLLSSISGAGVVAFKAEGASHEFTTLPGVKEDLVQVMLNLKDLRFKVRPGETEADTSQPVKLEIKKTGAGSVTGADLSASAYLEISNPDHLIATLNSANDKIDLEVLVGFGMGYLSIEESEALYGQNDYISVDAVFSPVLRVRYKLENTRVGRQTNLDKLNLAIETDGSMTPQAAFEEAAAILKEHYTVLSGATEMTSQNFQLAPKEQIEPQQTVIKDERLMIEIEDLRLSARTINALINNNLYTVKDVIQLSDNELKELRGFGTIALTELKEQLSELGF